MAGMTDRWEFDESVAKRFDEEARKHIPHYEEVIQASLSIALDVFPDKKARVLDVGSALGHTLEVFRAAGFEDVHGVDNSAAMLAHSRVRDNLILSDSFPSDAGMFDVVTANWTLHFIRDASLRALYIHDISKSLSAEGVFILTDKMEATQDEYDGYHNFKRTMGLSDTEINEKARALEGVLIPFPVQWYEEILSQTGFRSVEVIDSQWCFNTFVCRR